MFLGAWEGHHRSLAKAISWRLAGSLDTLVLSYLVTRSFLLAGSIAETITKIVLYYIHERAWTIVRWGKGSQKHRAFREFRVHLRAWAAQSAAAVAEFAAHLLHLFSPAKWGVIGSFLVCFAIVLTPPQFHLQPLTTTTTWSPSAPEQHDSEAATAELFVPA